MVQTVKRSGISLADGRETTLGFWDDALDQRHGEGTWVARIKQERAALLRIARRHHEQNQAIAIAKASGQKPVLAEPEFRVRQARVEQKQIAEIERRIALIGGEAHIAKLKLRPFEYKTNDANLRAELRGLMRSLPPAERVKLLQRPAYRAALLEGEPELAGVDATLADRIREEELRSKFPTEMQNYDDVLTAEEATVQALKACKRAVDSELLATGQSITEPTQTAVQAAEWA